MTDEKGSGRTAQQMNCAPTQAIYVWCNSMLDYPRALARKLNRNDLEIVSPEWLNTAHGLRERIIVDHACQLDDRAQLFVNAHNAMRGMSCT